MDLEDKGQFSILDYIFFIIVLIISSCIGLYYAIKSRKTATSTEEYLLGGRKVGLFPICCSIVATTLTGVTTVGLSTETYAYGSYNLMGWYNMVVVGIITSWIILPVFAELKLTSTFKYLELRFNRRVRILASGLYLLSGLIYLPFVLYVPALIFQRVTGLDIYVTVTALSLICAIYTAIGGFKAVIWTDVVQMILLITSFITITAVGIYSAGGLTAIFAAGSRGGRFQVVNTSDHNSRSSAWGWLFSTVLIFIYQLGLSQTSMQRFISLRNLRDMRTSLFVILLTLIIFTALPIFLGVIVYANYETCDLFAAGIIRKIDQILPYFIQDKASLFLGFNGIFIAGIFSAGLSTTSSFLNTMSGIFYEDFVRLMYPRLQGNTPGRIMKITVLVLGVIQIGFVYFIEKMGSVAKIASQCGALNSCALLTLFTLGLLFPMANSTGAQCGAIASIVSVFTLILGSIGQKQEPMLPLRTDGCQNVTERFLQVLNSTLITPVTSNAPVEKLWLFRINFMYFAFIGTVIGITVGYVASVLTGGNTVEDQKLLATFMRKKYLPEEEMTLRRNTQES